MAAKKKAAKKKAVVTDQKIEPMPATVTTSSSSSEEKVVQLMDGRFPRALTNKGRIFQQRSPKHPWEEVRGPKLD